MQMADVTYEKVGSAMVITMSRAGGNSWSAAMLEEATGRINLAATDPDLKVIRLRARDEVFCLGRDREARDALALQAESRRLAHMIAAWKSTPLLTVAEVQGDAAGFGANLVGLADFAAAADGARFSFPEVGVGLVPTLVMAWLPTYIGYKRSMEMVTTGRPIDAETARSWGLVNYVLPRADLPAFIDEMLSHWDQFETPLLREIKRFATTTRYWRPDHAGPLAVDALALSGCALFNRQDH
jgi:methylglutaconyl-CoA hydratase